MRDHSSTRRALGMKRMWRVAWTDNQATLFADYPKRRQAVAHIAALRALRGAKVGAEIAYPIWVWAS